jgi:hypothetical protein
VPLSGNLLIDVTRRIALIDLPSVFSAPKGNTSIKASFSWSEPCTTARTEHFLEIDAPNLLRFDDSPALRAGGVQSGEDFLIVYFLAGRHCVILSPAMAALVNPYHHSGTLNCR